MDQLIHRATMFIEQLCGGVLGTGVAFREGNYPQEKYKFKKSSELNT